MTAPIVWKKLGLVFCPDGQTEWMRSHAANPVAEHLEGDLFRVFFSARDSANRSQICSLLMSLAGDSPKVLPGSLRLVLSHGKNGCFDDSGVTVTGLIRKDNQWLLYFLGWNLGVTIPFRNAIGVAVSNDGERFERLSDAPMIDRNPVDPVSLSYPFVLWDEARYRMWYGSCEAWDGPSVSDYRFSLKYAESVDGLEWNRTGTVAVPCDFPAEDAIARPFVMKEQGLYKMWYSMKRGIPYRMGYAESSDAIHWIRMDDKAGLRASGTGDWDSDMVEYPYVFDHNGSRFMLYNGNGYGKSGFGLAMFEGR